MSIGIQQKRIISKKDYIIPAILTTPNEETHCPCVIMCHGTASDKNEVQCAYMLASQRFAQAGIASLRFDFVGTGDSQIDYINYNYSSATSDVEDVIAYAKSLGYSSIHLLGWSQGGTIALLSANSDEVQSIITWAGAVDLGLLATKEAYRAAKRDGYYNYEPGFRPPLKLGLKWFEEVYATDVCARFKESNKPVCAIAGTKDNIVDPIQSQQIVASSTHPDSKLVMIEGADHIFNVFKGFELLNQVIDTSIGWINRE